MIVKFCELFKNNYNITLITTFKPLYKEIKNLKEIDSVLTELKDIKDFKDIILENDIMLLTKPDYMFYHPNTYVWILANYVVIESNLAVLKVWSERYFNHQYVKKITFVSPVIEQAFLSTNLVPKEKSIVIPSWVESVKKKPRKYEDIKEFKVLWLSRFIAEKGWEDLFSAVRNTDIKTEFIGYGNDFEKALELKNKEKLNNIELLGFVENAIDYLNNNASVYVFTSKDPTESFGLSLLEAMSIGIPCISSNIPTSRYVLGDKGLFYNTIDELKVLILELKNNKDLYNEQAKYSIERAKLFHKDNVKKIWKKILF